MDFASAYKLSRAHLDKKAIRRKRKSVEQRESRHDDVNKRRNLVNLSPLDEADLTVVQNKHYAGKTPNKNDFVGETAKKQQSRLEQLKLWKVEREKKRKEEAKSSKNKPVFRTSKAVARADTLLFKESKTMNHPVKPVPAPVTIVKPEPKRATKSTSIHKSPTKPVETRTRKRQISGSHTQADTRPITRTRHSSRKQPELKESTVACKKPTSRNTRQQQPVSSNTRQSTRITRQMAKKLESKTEDVKKPEVQETFKVPELLPNTSKVTTRIPSQLEETQESFAPVNFSFNMSSFVIQPLSPNSANGFLCPGQDTFTSFMDTAPKMISTPKRTQTNQATHSKDQDQRKTKVETTLVGSTTKETKTRRSTRRSVATDIKPEEIKPTVKETEKIVSNEPKMRRSSRLSTTTSVNSTDGETFASTPDQSTRSRRSSRRSVLSSSVSKPIAEEPDHISEVTVVSSPSAIKTQRRSTRRSVAVDAEQTGGLKVDQGKVGAGDMSKASENLPMADMKTESVPVKRTPKRHSTRRSLAVETVAESEMNTPTRSSSKRKQRASLAVFTIAETVPEVNSGTCLMEDNEASTSTAVDKPATPSNSVFSPIATIHMDADCITSTAADTNTTMVDDITCETTDNSGTPAVAGTSLIVNVDTPPASLEDISMCSTSDNYEDVFSETETEKENMAPVFTPSYQRNRSFGGFRLPSADSAVLSSKRSAKRKDMPKSPEEWVQLLRNSPMVEMSRRKPKIGNTSLPALNFDDLDLDDNEPVSTTPSSVDVGTSQDVDMPLEAQTGSPVVNTAAVESSPARKPSSPPAVVSSSPDVRACLAVVTAASSSPSCNEETMQPGSSDSPQSGPRESVRSTATPTCSKTEDESIVGVQVGEVTSSQDGHFADDDVRYFRHLLISETQRLNVICEKWTNINDSTPGLTEEIQGQIRTTVGQANLLMNQRFKQFSGLVDDCEFKQGEKETTCTDLKGFWDMIYFQVEDVDKKFADLGILKDNKWQVKKSETALVKPKKKLVKPVVKKPVVKSKFAAFRAKMKKKDENSSDEPEEKPEEKVFEVPGFFQVSSPVRSPKPHCEAGSTPKKCPPPASESVVGSTEKDSLKPPTCSGSGNKLAPYGTPARKSYVPAIPSPLLQDTTPRPRPARTCATKSTPHPLRRILAGESTPDSPVKNEATEQQPQSSRQSTPLKALSPGNNSTVNSTIKSELGTPTLKVEPKDETASPVPDADISRLLQPTTSANASPLGDYTVNDFMKLLEPMKGQSGTKKRAAADTGDKKHTDGQPAKRRRSSLKTSKSAAQRRRSSSRSLASGDT